MSSGPSERVLYFCGRLPLHVRGGLDLRVRHQLLALRDRWPTAVFALSGEGLPLGTGFEMWRVSSAPNMSTSIEPRQILQSMVLDGATPFQHLFSEHAAGELRDAVTEFRPDVVIVSRLALMAYADVFQECGVARVILDLDETAHHLNQTMVSLMPNRAQEMYFRRWCEGVERFESEVVRTLSEVWVSSPIEAAHVASLYPQLQSVSVVPNAVDVSSYSSRPLAERSRFTLLFMGLLGYPPNADAARFVVKELVPLLPHFTAKIVGPGSPEWLRDVQDLRVDVVGSVPLIQPYLLEAGMAVIPLRAGGGTRLKAIEAMAADLPIVSTRLGVEGLGMLDGVHYLQAETPQEFADACRMLATDDTLCAALTSQARLLLLENFSLPALHDAIAAALDVRTTSPGIASK